MSSDRSKAVVGRTSWQRAPAVAAVCASFVLACSSSHGGGAPTRVASLAAPSAPVAPAAASTEGQPPPATEALAHDAYDHEDVLALLRDDDSVVPKRPPVHHFHTVYNREAPIPPMCYTRTEGKHNPCYVCHQDRAPDRPNAMDDGELQREYSFSDLGTTNRWHNLFEDRTLRIASISDQDIERWVSEDNYSELAPRLRETSFKGFIPDLANLQLGAKAFDGEGFALDGSHWVAFNYKPLPSTFWPTNGATDDVMIRLPEPYRSTRAGKYSRDVYKANLALVEANVKDLPSITVDALDETAAGADLNGDGQLGVIDRITVLKDYVGAAQGALKRRFLYPQHTELLHSVRYVGVDQAGNVYVPQRMKELRYMRKYFQRTEPQLAELYLQEKYAKEDGQLPGYIDRGDHGLDNELGWVLQSFIENRSGRLRVASYEENLFCMGCHTSLGATIDSTFSFVRKVDGAAGWGYIDLRGMPDAPSMGETQGEIAAYLERAGGGSELRSNAEMEARFFKKGAVDPRKVRAAPDVYVLITPSRRRALDLNKAYRTIVDDQDYLFGRDASVVPPINVYTQVDNEKAPTLPEALTYRWDIRLDWSRAELGARRKARP